MTMFIIVTSESILTIHVQCISQQTFLWVAIYWSIDTILAYISIVYMLQQLSFFVPFCFPDNKIKIAQPTWKKIIRNSKREEGGGSQANSTTIK